LFGKWLDPQFIFILHHSFLMIKRWGLYLSVLLVFIERMSSLYWKFLLVSLLSRQIMSVFVFNRFICFEPYEFLDSLWFIRWTNLSLLISKLKTKGILSTFVTLSSDQTWWVVIEMSHFDNVNIISINSYLKII